ncbi:hypothetical protein KC19_8G176100 [Ceratodon purpureus]|uniref:Uncharacterized protein n=1 Tax=Ceratodon purpureus TaxID=3225 RepID=A0A8T0H531_CERPU|nr:hypothetical protein KC19_8G176100 [Ceratodon purpureus]
MGCGSSTPEATEVFVRFFTNFLKFYNRILGLPKFKTADKLSKQCAKMHNSQHKTSQHRQTASTNNLHSSPLQNTTSQISPHSPEQSQGSKSRRAIVRDSTKLVTPSALSNQKHAPERKTT